MKTKFLSVCTGITLVLFGASCFFYSINHAFAQPGQKVSKPLTNEISKIGKYQISITQLNKNNGNYLVAVILNTETGKSETYRCDTEIPNRTWDKDNAQFGQFSF